MPLAINDWDAEIINITSPTTSVDAQTLHDFIEDEMSTPVGMLYEDIINPEGKIEDPGNPGVFSQIIMIFNTPWQVQFWGSSGYTTIFGGKLVGGLSDQPIKATGTAGDITVLSSPVDGLAVVVETGTSGLTAQESADLAQINTVITGLSKVAGISGENVIWSGETFDANNNMTGATITQYDDNTLTTPLRSWTFTATYNLSNNQLTSYQMVED